jgi:tRNA (guanosine-2'-O-)-methyltransferase
MKASGGLTQFLKPYITEHKQALIEEVLNKRTRHLTVVLEDIHHSHNASAVVRSCDCFGIQDVHIIEGRNEYTINPYVVQGSAKWVSVHKYPQTETNKNTFNHLKQNGYRLVGTSPNPSHQSVSELSTNQKVALVFGTEETGLSDFAMQQMDDFVHIPMFGFTESFNISVSAALCLYELSGKIRTEKIEWQLSENEKDELRLEWYKKVIARSDILEREYLRISNISN